MGTPLLIDQQKLTLIGFLGTVCRLEDLPNAIAKRESAGRALLARLDMLRIERVKFR